jgi:DNA-binding MarR family transcriptional regulator
MTLPEQFSSCPSVRHFCSIHSLALLEGRFTAYQLAILLALQAKGGASQKEIADMAGMSVSSVKKTLQQLIAMGELEAVARWDENGSRLPNVYQYPEGQA